MHSHCPTAQDATQQGRVPADALPALAVLGHGLSTVVHGVVRLDREFLGALGDVRHLGTVRQATGHGATHVLAVLRLEDAATARHVTSGDQHLVCTLHEDFFLDALVQFLALTFASLFHGHKLSVESELLVTHLQGFAVCADELLLIRLWHVFWNMTSFYFRAA